MHFASLFASILFATTVRSAFLFRREDDDGPVIVKATVTEVDVQTNLHVVNAPTTTIIEVNWITSTQTFTRYTATVTSNIKGVPVTITSPVLGTTEVVSQVEASAAPTTENTANTVGPTVATTTQALAQASSSDQIIILSPMTVVSPTPTTPSSESMVPTPSSSQAIVSSTITAAPDSTASSENWSTYNLSTETSEGVCFVNYDYIDLDEPISTVTQVATTTLYVTRQ